MRTHATKTRRFKRHLLDHLGAQHTRCGIQFVMVGWLNTDAQTAAGRALLLTKDRRSATCKRCRTLKRQS